MATVHAAAALADLISSFAARVGEALKLWILFWRGDTIWMKAYLITTGTVFGLITVAHIWRMFAEGSHLATDPIFLLLTVLAAALCIWAWCLFKSPPHQP